MAEPGYQICGGDGAEESCEVCTGEDGEVINKGVEAAKAAIAQFGVSSSLFANMHNWRYLVRAVMVATAGGAVTNEPSECHINIRQVNEPAGRWLWECMTCRDEYGNGPTREDVEREALAHRRLIDSARREEAAWEAKNQ